MIARSFTTGGHFEERTMTVSKNVLMALLILSYATWGGGMIAMKYAFESFTAMQVVFARVAFAGVIYLALYRLWSHIPYQKGDWSYLLAMVGFERCLFCLCGAVAVTYTAASQGGVIAACFPLCTAVAAWLFLGEKLTKKTIIAMLLAVAGVAGASLAAESSDQASNPILGNLLMVGAVLSATGYAVCVRFISRRYSFLSARRDHRSAAFRVYDAHARQRHQARNRRPALYGPRRGFPRVSELQLRAQAS